MNEQWIIMLIVSYLCGSIPFGFLIGLCKGVDLRKNGSGNIGATNCGRVIGRRWGLACFVLDLLKGLLPVAAAGWWFGWSSAQALPAIHSWVWLAIAAAAVSGHMFPIWLRFSGGKGVATGFGVVLGIWPYLTFPALAAAGTWLLFATTLRYVSLASIIAAVVLPVYVTMAAIMQNRPWPSVQPMVVALVAMAFLIVLQHRSNLRRLFNGTEGRLGE